LTGQKTDAETVETAANNIVAFSRQAAPVTV